MSTRDERRVGRQERGAKRTLERVERAAAAGLAPQDLAPDGDLRGRVRARSRAVVPDPRLDRVRPRLERPHVALARAPDEQLERRLRVLEAEALALELLDLQRELARERPVGIELEPVRARRLDHVVAPAQLADQDAPLVADARGVDVLVRARVDRDGLDVDPALVRERGVADERQPRVRGEVRDLVDVRGRAQ